MKEEKLKKYVYDNCLSWNSKIEIKDSDYFSGEFSVGDFICNLIEKGRDVDFIYDKLAKYTSKKPEDGFDEGALDMAKRCKKLIEEMSK